ncbi:aminoacyl-tRNA hydrolase [Candidatus Ishikawella capsulata]|uniref:Peptidyl-tRNA hydrolase n=1 Tax=Candidatus Ishikawaella capsulata Mpkobe TaxID=476281 RepID=C5WD66_9ENTR|nr:aminoacyl-tRNA hydrolase [Candidatus Ishikawaella capsulata]BAH83272.1 peptidyl-tRNA hydrolase [Candidatus Ishikawaella capsulata Mpkobe]
MKLIIGLANPGKKYIFTRHNVGAWYLKLLSLVYKASLKSKKYFFGDIACLNIYGESVLLLIPNTFMNCSGKSVAAVVNFYQIEYNKILIAHDELYLPPGTAKFKHGGGHGGHNGLRDIISNLNNHNDFHRLRIGIGHPGKNQDIANFVLGNPSLNEKKQIDEAIHVAISSTELWLREEHIKAMNHLNSFKSLL